MLRGMVVKIDGEEGDDVGNGLDLVLRVAKYVSLVQVDLA
jgi:hypothetical protein